MTRTAQAATVAFGPFETRASDVLAGAEAGNGKGASARRAFQARDLLLRAAAFVVLTTASTALLALPYLADAADPLGAQAAPSARLHQAFQVAEAMPAPEGLTEALSAAAQKADRLTSGPDCGAQTWPHIHPRCLASADAGSAAPVRTVTVEYRTGESASALVRLPLQQLAAKP